MNRLKALARKPTVWAVLAFVVLITWGLATEARELDDLALNVGVGTALVNGESDGIAHVGVNWRDRWVAQLMVGGPVTHTHTGEVSDRYVAIQAARRVMWRRGKAIAPFAEIGFAYFDKAPRNLLGCDFQHFEGLGVELWSTLTLGYQHHSTAGRCRPNTGLDHAYFMLRLAL